MTEENVTRIHGELLGDTVDLRRVVKRVHEGDSEGHVSSECEKEGHFTDEDCIEVKGEDSSWATFTVREWISAMRSLGLKVSL